MSRQDPWDERGWVSKYPDTNCVWYAGDRAGLVEMLNQMDGWAGGQTRDAASRGQSKRPVNRSLVMTSTCVFCSCVARDWRRQGERLVVRLSRPSAGPPRLTMDNRFLICCPLFPFRASAGLGPGESGCLGLGCWRRGGQGQVSVSVSSQCPAGQREDPVRARLQSMRLDQGLQGRCDQACEWLAGLCTRRFDTVTWQNLGGHRWVPRGRAATLLAPE